MAGKQVYTKGISAVHLNGHLMCAIDIETTGLKVGFHDIWQITIVPVAPNFTVNEEIPYFTARMLPKRPENADPQAISRQDLADALSNGMDPDRVEQRLQEWFEKLPLGPRKKIVPLGHNYSNFDRNFIMDWLGGPLNYEAYFRSDHRDTMTCAIMINDIADWHNERIPFPRVNLTHLCCSLGFRREGAHDATMDCMMTIECYRRLMRYRDFMQLSGNYIETPLEEG